MINNIFLIGELSRFKHLYNVKSQNINSGPAELLTIHNWYEQNVPAEKRGKTVAARKAHFAYYLDMKFQLMPMAESYEEFISKLREKMRIIFIPGLPRVH